MAAPPVTAAVPAAVPAAPDAPAETPAETPLDITDEEVPLGVLDDELTDTTIDIDDNEVPLAAPAAGRIWWSWIPVIGAIASAVESYRQNKKEKEESGDEKREE